MRNRLLDGLELLAWMKTQCTVTEAGCWEWQGSRSKLGYGTMSYRGKNRAAHRISCHLVGKLDIEDPREGRHTCDNPPCFNDAHILPGTHLDNMQDRGDRGRTVGFEGGSKHPRAKLTDHQVASILADPRTAVEVARELGMNPETIRRLRRGETYA